MAERGKRGGKNGEKSGRAIESVEERYRRQEKRDKERGGGTKKRHRKIDQSSQGKGATSETTHLLK